MSVTIVACTAIFNIGPPPTELLVDRPPHWLGQPGEAKGLSFAGIKPGENWEAVKQRLQHRAKVLDKGPLRYSLVAPRWAVEVTTIRDSRGSEIISVIFQNAKAPLMLGRELIVPFASRTSLSEVSVSNLKLLRDDGCSVSYTDGEMLLSLQFIGGSRNVGVLCLSVDHSSTPLAQPK